MHSFKTLFPSHMFPFRIAVSTNLRTFLTFMGKAMPKVFSDIYDIPKHSINAFQITEITKFWPMHQTS